MNRTTKIIGKIALWLFAASVISVCGLFAWATVKRSEKDREFPSSMLVPIARHVEQVKYELGRLPTTDEFRAWADKEYENKLIEYYPSRPDFCKSWGKQGDAFLVGAWRGEWIHYYCSWNGKNFAE